MLVIILEVSAMLKFIFPKRFNLRGILFLVMIFHVFSALIFLCTQTILMHDLLTLYHVPILPLFLWEVFRTSLTLSGLAFQTNSNNNLFIQISMIVTFPYSVKYRLSYIFNMV